MRHALFGGRDRRAADIAHAHGLPVHLDGARFANALVAEGCSPAEMTWRAGVDVLCLGGTKNGLMGVEAVVFFDPAKAWEFQLRRKRAGHLPSKHRYLSAQMLAWLEDDLWLDLARHANAMAERLEAGLAGHAQIAYPRGGNMLFATWPRAGHDRLQAGRGILPLARPCDMGRPGPDRRAAGHKLHDRSRDH